MFRTFTYILFLLPIGCIFSADAVLPQFYWRDYAPGDIPCDAFEAAPGRYIGQVQFNNMMLVAEILSHLNVALIEQGGKQVISSNIKIFCTPFPARFYWEFVTFNKPHDQQMRDAVKGGYQTDLSLNLFIGKIIMDGEWFIGKVIPLEHEFKGILLWNKEGKAAIFKEFYLLKYNSTGGNDCSCP